MRRAPPSGSLASDRRGVANLEAQQELWPRRAIGPPSEAERARGKPGLRDLLAERASLHARTGRSTRCYHGAPMAPPRLRSRVPHGCTARLSAGSAPAPAGPAWPSQTGTLIATQYSRIARRGRLTALTALGLYRRRSPGRLRAASHHRFTAQHPPGHTPALVPHSHRSRSRGQREGLVRSRSEHCGCPGAARSAPVCGGLSR